MPALREIPAHISTRKGSPQKTTPPASRSDLLIDFDIEGPKVTGTDSLANPFEIPGSAAVNETRVTLRTEEEQQAAARDREEIERKEMEKEVNSRRDARRKSLANRRVSFAPEATLHTWDVVMEYQDSTTSSNSTNSTRRASSATNDTLSTPRTPGPTSSDPMEAPSTPPEQVEEEITTESPERQRDLHQKKRRRSSVIPPMNFNNPDDEAFSSSPLSDTSAGDAEEIIEDDGSISDSDDDDDGTMMSIDGADTTDLSMASVKSASSDSSGRLEEALRLAAEQAGTQGIDFDEHGEDVVVEDEDQDEDVVASFKPWSKKAAQNLQSLQDQENINPFSPAFKAVAPPADDFESGDEMTMDMTHAVGRILPAGQADDDELSMDVTRAFGGIISNQNPMTNASKRKSVSNDRRQSIRRSSSGSASSQGDETMDFTMAVGGIQSDQNELNSDQDEDMTMEFTSVVGGVLPPGNITSKNRRRSSVAPKPKSQNKRNRQSVDSSAGDDTMDMETTTAIGGIMPPITEVTAELDQTVGMDMTTAVGGIFQTPSSENRTRAKKVMELETDMASSPFQAIISSPPKSSAPVHTIASETGSPSMAAFKGKAHRRSNDARNSSTPKSKLSSTPVKKPTTPSKQLTPQPPRPTTPGKTPPSKNIIMRTSSPKRLFKAELKAAATSTPQSAKSKTATPNKLFQQDKNTGIATPSFVLTPKRRLSSGIGLDREGLGSPHVAAILDRRGSIGEMGRPFVPSQLSTSGRGVRFGKPSDMEQEIEREREEEREFQRKIMEREVNEEKDVTLNLKEMIQSLTPKKKSLKGRKSLHVGAAKGILGKRPVELDEDEDDDGEENDGIKRLKNHQGSPVKNVRLQGPPSKAETTTGRLTRATRKSLETPVDTATPTTTTSSAKGDITTPHGQERFKDAGAASRQEAIPFTEKEPVEDSAAIEESFSDERIQLQDFLNMTSIRFMELTTTKRRHTIAQKAPETRDNKQGENASLEDCVAAGAAVIPMLELFQHVSVFALIPKPDLLINDRHATNLRTIFQKAERLYAKLRRRPLRRTHHFSASTFPPLQT